MEPVRGGKLANFTDARLEALRPGKSTASWGFRFLQGLSNVKMILSGMSNFDQLKENIQTYCEEKPLNEKEWNTLQEIAKEIIQELTACTGCRYCT